MEYVIIPLVALLASGLTLFSGFGLGTLLLPAFALFFPVNVAVALTAVVHMLNNLFKLILVGKYADRKMTVRFGVPAVLAAIAGAALLVWISRLPALVTYQLGGQTFDIALVKVIVAILMIGFALVEILPKFQKLEFDARYLPLGGIISGFFGGLSGHQGAMRAAFLVRAGLTKEAFIATGVVIAVLVDVTRLTVYAAHFSAAGVQQHWPVLVAATIAAFLGAFIGSRLLKKVTLRAVQVFVAVMLIGIALLLGAGII
ncbi:MAG: TSUP family transporter [Armatimonadota bacterium]